MLSKLLYILFAKFVPYIPCSHKASAGRHASTRLNKSLLAKKLIIVFNFLIQRKIIQYMWGREHVLRESWKGAFNGQRTQ